MSDLYRTPPSSPGNQSVPYAPQKYLSPSTPPPNMPPTPPAPKKSFLDGFTNSMKSLYANLKTPPKAANQGMDSGAVSTPANSQTSIFDGGKKKRRTRHSMKGKGKGKSKTGGSYKKKGMMSKTRKGKKGRKGKHSTYKR